jgi:hypothetical protein
MIVCKYKWLQKRRFPHQREVPRDDQPRSTGGVGIVRRLQRQYSFLSFPYACPEPVWVK